MFHSCSPIYAVEIHVWGVKPRWIYGIPNSAPLPWCSHDFPVLHSTIPDRQASWQQVERRLQANWRTRRMKPAAKTTNRSMRAKIWFYGLCLEFMLIHPIVGTQQSLWIYNDWYILYYIILYCIVLYYIVLYYIILYCIILYYILLYYVILYYIK